MLRSLSFFFAAILLVSPAAQAIQTDVFPDEPSRQISMSSADAMKFDTARQNIHGAVEQLVKVGNVQGESKKTALKTIDSNARIINAIAVQTGNKVLADFVTQFYQTGGSAGDAKSLQALDTVLQSLEPVAK